MVSQNKPNFPHLLGLESFSKVLATLTLWSNDKCDSQTFYDKETPKLASKSQYVDFI
jgi:hypothetical protein